jgi:hypothetical protein
VPSPLADGWGLPRRRCEHPEHVMPAALAVRSEARCERTRRVNVVGTVVMQPSMLHPSGSSHRAAVVRLINSAGNGGVRMVCPARRELRSLIVPGLAFTMWLMIAGDDSP